jgi:hypothetical protein
MRTVPESVTRSWIDSLNDEDLVAIERRLFDRFTVLERREKKQQGERFQLMRGSAELMSAWDRWSRVSNVTRERSLRRDRSPAAQD